MPLTFRKSGGETVSKGASFWALNGHEGIRTSRQPSYLPNTATADFYLLQIGDIRAGKLLAVPGRPNDELEGNRLNQQQKRDRRRRLAVDGALQPVRPNWLSIGLKKS